LPLLPRAKQIIEELPISSAEREAIFSGNALRLLGRAT
jgi:predicted TIM-barrel fold metal-dependent hydrolase